MKVHDALPTMHTLREVDAYIAALRDPDILSITPTEEEWNAIANKRARLAKAEGKR
ncbi:MAG: hypothetical protein AAFR68_08250 [Pseudomonadota bacterium]